MKKILGILLLCMGIIQAQDVKKNEIEQKSKIGFTLKRLEKTVVAGLLTAGFAWTCARFLKEWKKDRDTEVYKGAERRWVGDGQYALTTGALAYLTLRCGYYMLKSAQKMVFGNT